MQGHRDFLPLGLLASGTSGSRWFSLTLLHERIRRRIWWCHFSTFIDIVTETTIVSSRTLPDGFPLPTVSKNSLYTLFCSLILDHDVSFIISVSGSRSLISCVLVDTSFHHRFQSVIIRYYFLLMNLQVVQFQKQSWVSQTLEFLICTILPRRHQEESLSFIVKFHPISNRIPKYLHFDE